MKRGAGAAALIAWAALVGCDGGKQRLGVETGFAGDTFIPWSGGAAYYRRWSHAPWTDDNVFPISVWMQNPANAARFQAVGINLFVGLWQGPTDEQLAGLTGVTMPAICDQSGVWRAHLADPAIRGWLQPDGPDNAQMNASGGYDPCTPPADIVAGYRAMVANDPTRPVFLNLGRGVADPQWVGRGTCTGQTDTYPEYAKGGDILAYDLYAVNDGYPLETVATGAENLRAYSGGTKPVIAVLEASNINGVVRPTPAQLETEVWMALVHGAAGIEYFCHRITAPLNETDCLDDSPSAAALARINQQLRQLAPALNAPPVANGVTTSSSAPAVPVDTRLARAAGATYLFAVAMRGASTTATFTLRAFPPAATAEVIGEGRSLAVTGGVFTDAFTGYAVHRYRIVAP